MVVSNFYTVETLQRLNDSHDYGYSVTQSDTDKVNRLIKGIQQERNRHEKPIAGDIIGYTSRNGDFFSSAHIGRVRDKNYEICLSDIVPFCYENENGTGYDIHEGVWVHPKNAVLKPAGIKVVLFRTWGHTGRCDHGFIYFKTFVRSWEYAEPEPMFGEYTTRNWTKYLISSCPDPERKGEFFYKANGFTLYSRTELDRLAKTLHGELFNGIYRNSLVLWGYRMVWKILVEQEWNGAEADIHLSFLGESPVKIRTCEDNRTIFIYKKNDNGKV